MFLLFSTKKDLGKDNSLHKITHRIIDSQNHRMVGVEKDLGDHLDQPPC